MGKSPILAIDELAPGQAQAYSTVNDAVAALEEAMNAKVTIIIDPDTGTPDEYIVSELNAVRYQIYVVNDATGPATIEFPTAIVDGAAPFNRTLTIFNDNAFTLTVVGAPDYEIPAGGVRTLHIYEDQITELSQGGVTGGGSHTTAFFSAGNPTTNVEVLRYVFTEEVTWAVDFAGSAGSARVAPTVRTGFLVYQNGTKIGRIDVSSGGGFTFITDDPAPVEWAPADILTVKYCEYQVGAINFSNTADNADTVTINDGSTNVVFTFGSGGLVVGASALDSAQNLKAAIEASALADTILVEGAGSSLAIINIRDAGGGSLAKSDGDNDYAITAFTSDSTSADYGVTFYGVK